MIQIYRSAINYMCWRFYVTWLPCRCWVKTFNVWVWVAGDSCIVGHQTAFGVVGVSGNCKLHLVMQMMVHVGLLMQYEPTLGEICLANIVFFSKIPKPGRVHLARFWNYVGMFSETYIHHYYYAWFVLCSNQSVSFIGCCVLCTYVIHLWQY
jgi:hypothetical protein